MKRFMIITAIAWLMIGIACMYKAAADTTHTMYVHVQEGSYLNGRLKPNRDSSVEIRLFPGDAVNVINVVNGWAEIAGGEAGTAWCCIDYLADYAVDEDEPLYTVTANGRVRIRKAPDDEVIGYVHDGDSVTVRFAIDGWAYLGDGYVMTKYLEGY